MREDEVEDVDEFLERIENAEPGDVVIFDEAQGSAPARKAQAIDLKKRLDLEGEK